MTKIRFYTDVTDRAALIQHLASQALSRQRHVTVYLQDREQAVQLSAGLWQQAADSFFPNELADAGHVALTPVQLVWQPEQVNQDDLLFNCQATLPKFFSRFRHVFELVSPDDNDKAAARQRWAFYRDRGYEIQHMNKQV
jgi:DNA polymerase III subunit chi